VAIFDPKKSTWCHVQGHSLAVPWDIAPKFQQTCLGYCPRLLPNFMPIGEVPAEKAMTEQKKENKQRNSKFNIPPILCMGDNKKI